MASQWITVLTLAYLTVTLFVVSVRCDGKYTTVPPEKQAELEKLDESLKSKEKQNDLGDFSGDVDPESPEKGTKVDLTTELGSDSSEEGVVQSTEAVVLTNTVSDSTSEETSTDSQEDGSGDVDLFATQFPENVQHALNETQDKELLPATDSTTEEGFVPVVITRQPPKSRPEEPETTTKEEAQPEVQVTTTEKPATTVEAKNESVVAIPAKVPEIKSNVKSDMTEDEKVTMVKVTTSVPSESDPSAQATKGSPPISRGLIVGIVIIGVIVLIALIVLLVYLLVFRPRRKALEHPVDGDAPQGKNGKLVNGSPKNNEESMSALVKELKQNKLSSGKDKTYGTELQDDMEDIKLNGTQSKRRDSPV